MIELHHSTGAEAPQQVTNEDLGTIRQREGWVWVDAIAPTAEEVEYLAEQFQIERLHVDDVLQFTEYPNLEHRDRYLFVIAHTPAADTLRLRTVEVDMFLGQDFLVTIRSEDSPGFEAVDRLTGAERLRGPDGLLAVLFDMFMRRMRVLVDSLDGEVDRLEGLAILGDPKVVEEIQALRRDVVRLRRVLIPQRDVLRSIARPTGGFVKSEAARGTLDSSFDDCLRALEELDSARSLLASALETYRATVGERTNEVMKVLTVFSAIVLPLGLMAGIYGMNFANMPELDTEYGYFVLLGAMAAFGIGLWLYFARRGFIGRPRVPRLDRAVGKGLASFVHLTLTPARSVWSLVVTPDEEDSEGFD
ncbi:MAG: magnesium transporter CorA family protein [Acidimicrobiia bacterium]